MNSKNSMSYCYHVLAFVAKTVILTWIILVVSYVMYEARGSLVSLLKGEVQLDVGNFIKFLAIFTGKPIYIRICIPYLSYPYNFIDVYEPISSMLLCFSTFWVSCGIILGQLSKTFKEVIFGAVLQFATLLIFCISFNCVYSVASTLIGFLLLIVSAYGSYNFKIVGETA